MQTFFYSLLIAISTIGGTNFEKGAPNSEDPSLIRFSCVDCVKRAGDCNFCGTTTKAIQFKGLVFEEFTGNVKREILIRHPFSIAYTLQEISIESAFGEKYSFKIQNTLYGNVHEALAELCICFNPDIPSGSFTCDRANGCSYVKPNRVGNNWYFVQYDSANIVLDTTAVVAIPQLNVSPTFMGGDTTGYRINWENGWDGLEVFFLDIPRHVYDDYTVTHSQTDSTIQIVLCDTKKPGLPDRCDTLNFDKSVYELTCQEVWNHIEIKQETNLDSIYFVAYCQGVRQDTTAIVPRFETPNVCEEFFICFGFDTICIDSPFVRMDTIIRDRRRRLYDTIITGPDTTITCDSVITCLDTTYIPTDTLLDCRDESTPDSCDFTAFWCCNKIEMFRYSYDQGGNWNTVPPPFPFTGWANPLTIGGLPAGYISYIDPGAGLCSYIEIMAGPTNVIYECNETLQPFGVSITGTINCNADLWIDAMYLTSSNCDDCFDPGAGAWYQFMRFDSLRPFFRDTTICDTTILYDTLYTNCDTAITCDTLITGPDTSYIYRGDTIIRDTTIFNDTLFTRGGCYLVIRDSSGQVIDTLIYVPKQLTCEEILDCLSDTSTLVGDSLYITESDGDTKAYFIGGGGGGGVSDHGGLTGLADDDHTQYLKIDGRGGGQEAIGGTGAGEDLTLRSTSNATLGNVVIEQPQFVDGADNTKTATFDLSGITTATNIGLTVQNATGTLALLGDIPTNVSELVNDAGYISSTAGDWTGTFDGQEGTYYLDYNNFTNTPTIPTVDGTAFGISWDANGDAATKNAIYDEIVTKLASGDNVSELVNDAGYLTSEVDADPTNEFQNLSWNDGTNTVEITNGTNAVITGFSDAAHTHVEAEITDLGNYLENVVEDATPQLGGNLDAQSNNLINVNNVDMDQAAPPAYAEGRVFYDNDKEALSYYNEANGVTVNIGREVLVRVYNNTGVTINDGQAVYISGNNVGTGLPEISLAQADAEATAQVIGLATHDIATSSIGYVVQIGVAHDLNTSAFGNGDRLYLSPSVAGGLTNTKPSRPDQIVEVGIVEKANAATGEILVLVDPDNGALFSEEINTLAELNAIVSDATLVDQSHTHSAADVTSGTFADGRISQSSVTQHEGAINHNSLLNYSIDEHRTINDAGSAATDLWSASKISTELAGKSATSHTHTKADVTDFAHASDHITGGADEVDGDQIDIDYTPSNYTPATTPSEASNIDHLAAHLYGVDQAIGGIGGGPSFGTEGQIPATNIGGSDFDYSNDLMYRGGVFTVGGEDAELNALINGSATNNRTLKLQNTGTKGSSGGAGITGFHNSGAAMVNGDRLGFMLFGGHNGTQVRNSVGFVAYSTETWTTGTQGSRLDIEASASGAGNTRELIARFDENGAAFGNLRLQRTTNEIVSTDLNGNIALSPNGTGDVILGNITVDADQTLGAGQDNFVETYDNATGKTSFEALPISDAAFGVGWNADTDAPTKNAVYDEMITKVSTGDNVSELVNDAGYISSTAGDWTGTFDGQEGTYYLDYNNHTNTPTIPVVEDAAFGGAWNGDLDAATKNAIFDYVSTLIASVKDDATPELGGQLIMNGNVLVDTFLSGEAFAVRDIVTLDTDLTNGRYYKADCDDVSRSTGHLIIALEATAGSEETFVGARIGSVEGFTGLSQKPYYISATAGAITDVVPSTTGQVVRVIGQGGQTNSILEFNASASWGIVE